MSDDYLIRNCAPTLAGIKTANLFTCPLESREELFQAIRRTNRRLKDKGLRVLPLRVSRDKALIYLYRPEKLARDLSDGMATCLLRQQGYVPGSCQKTLVQLIRKLRCQEGFPHEIGLFLGYPPEDVQGFITLGPGCCKCSGCWKVYGDEEAARKKFAQYKKCTQIYCRLWAEGDDIERLTVAG